MKVLKLYTAAAAVGRWPWAARGALGCGVACLAQLLIYAIAPMRAFPAALAFPAIVLSVWFLGLWGGVFCALAEAVLISQFPTWTQAQLSDANLPLGLRLALYLVFSVLLGWTMRQMARQRTRLRTQWLQQQLLVAQAERQLAEERASVSEALRGRDEVLQTALQANGMGLWVWDLQQGTTYYSDEMCRIAGVEPGYVDLLPTAWSKLVHPDDAERVSEAVMQTWKGLKDYHEQYRVVREDGSVRWLESQGKCLRDGEGRPTRVVGVMADITPRKMTEEAMLRTEKLAVAGRMAAAVAHEINNPLEAVENLLYLISTAETTEVVRSYAHMALEGLTRISLVTQQTLKFHRQSGAPVLTKLSEVVAAVLALFAPKLRTTGIATEIRVVGEERVECMPSETHHIFANLVSNAIDAMPRGGRLVIRVRPSRDWRDGETRGMRVTVADSGMGMSQATRQHIFEPFFTTKTDTGTGLGLWVVAQLTERRHGDVRVRSAQRAEACGTAFSVFLPYRTTPVTGGAATADPSR